VAGLFILASLPRPRTSWMGTTTASATVEKRSLAKHQFTAPLHPPM
jgi:hypothetical protein